MYLVPKIPIPDIGEMAMGNVWVSDYILSKYKKSRSFRPPPVILPPHPLLDRF